MGSRLAAFLAGYQPKKIPVIVHTMNDNATVQASMLMGQFARNLTAIEAPTPSNTPIRPPVTLIMMASMRNWLQIRSH